MRIISHRGNLTGKNEELENHPIQIEEILKLGYDVECDIRCIDYKLYLGHDEPQYEIPLRFLESDRILFHCKNKAALEIFYELHVPAHFFWHEEDQYTLTSLGYPIIYPGKDIVKRGILMYRPEDQYTQLEIDKLSAVCLDDLESFKKLFQI